MAHNIIPGSTQVCTERTQPTSHESGYNPSTKPRGPRDQTPFLLPNSQKQTVAHIPKPGLDHSCRGQLLVQAGDVNLHALGPLARGLEEARLRAEDAEDDDPLGAPLAQGLDGSGAGAAGRDDGVDDDGEARGGRLASCRAAPRRDVLGQVVVVLDGLEGGGLAV